MNVSREQVEAFAALFRGRTDAHGWGGGGVWREEPTLQHYERHLKGQAEGLGIFPLLDDASVHFAAIDLDEPDFEAAGLMADLLPGQAWVERSRSGNAHVWVFFSEPIEAWVARAVLRTAAEAAGYPRVELFPKQDNLKPGMLGNYINLPYHGNSRPIIDFKVQAQEWRPHSLELFLAEAHEYRVDPNLWRAKVRELGIAPPSQRDGGGYREAEQPHACAIHIFENRARNPVREPGRNIVLFNLAKQLLNWQGATEAQAWDVLREVNSHAEPEPLPEEELERIFANAVRGEYTSTGCDDPYMAPYVRSDCPIAKSIREENSLVR